MMDYWRRRLGLSAAAGLMDVTDATGAERRLEEAVEGWYAGLLGKADPRLVATEDFGQQAVLSVPEEGVIRVRFPERGVRPVSVKLTEWTHPVERFHAADSDVARLQESKWLRGRPDAPVAVLTADGLLLYGAAERVPGQPLRLQSLVMTARPADGSFVVDAGLLEESMIGLG